MGIVRKTITVTEQQDHWVKSRIAGGGFTNDSGVSDKTVPQVMEDVEARLRADGRSRRL